MRGEGIAIVISTLGDCIHVNAIIDSGWFSRADFTVFVITKLGLGGTWYMACGNYPEVLMARTELR